MAAFAVGAFVTQLLAGVAFGPMGAMLSKLFHTRYRYTAAAFSCILGGAVPPIIGATITAAFGSFVFGVFLAALSLISFVCVAALSETRDYDLNSSATSEG